MQQPERLSLIQGAVFAALGCTKIDYRSPKKMDEAAAQIAAFVEDSLANAERARAEEIDAIFAWPQSHCDCLPWPGKCPYCGGDAPVTNGVRDNG